MRVLLITATEDSPSHQAAAAALQRIAVPHDVLVSTTDVLARDQLYDDPGAYRYAGVPGL